MSTEEQVWRAHVVRRLRERNRKECDNFKEIIEQSKNLGREAGPAEHPS